MRSVFLGVDVGSVSTNLVVVDEAGELLTARYLRNDGQPVMVLQTGIQSCGNQCSRFTVAGVGVTGSGRFLAGAILGADLVKNEITAHAAASVYDCPEVRTVLEIGGQDSKLILIKNGLVADFAMNTVCAAGTGSFLDHQAERLKVPIEEFGGLALTATGRINIAGRCTVFAESDMIAKQQLGYDKAEIINGLCFSLVRNYLANLARDKQLESPVLFQGGVAANQGIRAAFEQELGLPVQVPPHFHVMGAIGAALLARKQMRKTGAPSQFYGWDRVAAMDLKPSVSECRGCSNRCEVARVLEGERVIAVWGDKCGKHSGNLTA